MVRGLGIFPNKPANIVSTFLLAKTWLASRKAEAFLSSKDINEKIENDNFIFFIFFKM